MTVVPLLIGLLLALPATSDPARADSSMDPAGAIITGTMLAEVAPLIVHDLEGAEVDLRAGLKPDAKDQRRMTLLVFWNTWCQPCVEEIPVLNEMKRYYGSGGLRVVAVGLDLAGDSPAKLAESAKQHGITYAVLFDAKGEARRRFGLNAVPAAALVDGAGKVVWLGRRLPPDLSSRIRAELTPGGAGASK